MVIKDVYKLSKTLSSCGYSPNNRRYNPVTLLVPFVLETSGYLVDGDVKKEGLLRHNQNGISGPGSHRHSWLYL